MGIEGKKLKKFTKEFKLSAVEDVLEYQMGLRETARKYGVTHKMIQSWVKIYLDKGISYFQDDFDRNNNKAILESAERKVLILCKKISRFMEDILISIDHSINSYNVWKAMWRLENTEKVWKICRIFGRHVFLIPVFTIDMPHQPKTLPHQMMGIYTYWYNGEFLKIGKAGLNSNAGFLSQYYNPRSARSTLTASIFQDDRMQGIGINESNIGRWIRNNCRRIDILLDSDLGIFSLELIKASLHYKYEPVYEGFIVQR